VGGRPLAVLLPYCARSGFLPTVDIPTLSSPVTIPFSIEM
jgi:hypothetical protein